VIEGGHRDGPRGRTHDDSDVVVVHQAPAPRSLVEEAMLETGAFHVERQLPYPSKVGVPEFYPTETRAVKRCRRRSCSSANDAPWRLREAATRTLVSSTTRRDVISPMIWH